MADHEVQGREASFLTFPISDDRQWMVCSMCGEKFPNKFEGLLAARSHAANVCGEAVTDRG